MKKQITLCATCIILAFSTISFTMDQEQPKKMSVKERAAMFEAQGSDKKQKEILTGQFKGRVDKGGFNKMSDESILKNPLLNDIINTIAADRNLNDNEKYEKLNKLRGVVNKVMENIKKISMGQATEPALADEVDHVKNIEQAIGKLSKD